MEIIDVFGYEGLYKVSSCGKVYKVYKDKLIELSQSLVDKRYLRVTLTKDKVSKTVKVHRIVLTSFLKTNGEGYVIDHINGIKTDNSLGNLEFVTIKENVQRSIKLGLKPNRQSKTRKDAKLSVEQVLLVRKMLRDGFDNKTIRTIANISSKDLYAIRNNRNYYSIQLDRDNTEVS